MFVTLFVLSVWWEISVMEKLSISPREVSGSVKVSKEILIR